MTGEKTAEFYIDSYMVNLKNVRYICAYSDGCEPNFESKESIKYTLENLDKIKENGSEKTLVLYEKE